jgi:hypothetical protein
LPPAQLERLFCGQPQVLKRNTTSQEAKRLVARLATIGAVARIQPATSAAAAATPTPPARAKPATALPDFSPFPRGAALRGALLLAAASELLFLLLYLLLLLAAAVGLLYFNLFTTWGAQLVGFGPQALLAQLGLLLLGLPLLLLLAKPLLAINLWRHHGMVLTAEQEPALHTFVEELCAQLDAPPPREIRLGNEVAVELDYLHGPLGFLLNRTVLTLSAPLIAATDLSQQAALIAQSLLLLHNKNLSPRAAFLLRRSDGWLQRASYGEDVVDRTLRERVAGGGALAAIASVLQRLIALSRRVLGWRLCLTRPLKRRLLHRLVADADKAALRLCGSEGFLHILEQQRLLSFTAQKLLPGLRLCWHTEGRLPDNLVQTLMQRAKQYPPSIHPQLRARQEREMVASHDPLPADSQRLYRVSKVRLTPAYPRNAPAATLLRNFNKLARRMTLRLYHRRLRLPVTPGRLTPTVTDRTALQQQRHIDTLFRQLYCNLIPLKLRHQMTLLGDSDHALAQRQAALQESGANRTHAELALRRCVDTEQALTDIAIQEVIYRAQLQRQWGLEAVGREGLEQIHLACREQEQELEESLRLLSRQLTPHVQRLSCDLVLLASPHAGALGNTAALREEVATLLEVLERIEQTTTPLRTLRLHTTLLQILLSFDHGRRGKLHDLIEEQTGDIQQLLAGLGATLKTTPYPFGVDHHDLMAFALRHAYPDEGPGGVLDRGLDVVAQIGAVQHQLLARLCAIALQVEQRLGL